MFDFKFLSVIVCTTLCCCAHASEITYTLDSQISSITDPDGLISSLLGVEAELGDPFHAELTIHDTGVQPAFVAPSENLFTTGYFLPTASTTFTTNINGTQLSATDVFQAVSIGDSEDIDIWLVSQHLTGASGDTTLVLTFQFFTGGFLFDNQNSLTDESYFINLGRAGWDGVFVDITQLEGEHFSPDRFVVGSLLGAFESIDSPNLTITVAGPHTAIIALIGITLVSIRRRLR